MLGWGSIDPLQQRLRKIYAHILILTLAVVLMLSWAGFVEAFISQYHQPVISYDIKIAFGILELIVLVYYFYQRAALSHEP